MIERERGPVKYEIVKHIGVLNTYPTGWNKEFNIVRWNDKSDKYDVRDWSPGHERMSRGVTMFEGELKRLIEFCADLFGEAQAEAQTQSEPNTADRVAEDEVPF